VASAVKFRYSLQAMRGGATAPAGAGVYVDDVTLTETRCPGAVWRVQNFSRIMEAADGSTTIDSPPFYSAEGYGFGVRLQPRSGYSDYTGDYTGLYFHLLSGENDVVMDWPAVNRQATLVVMDQDPDVTMRMSTARSLTTDRITSKSPQVRNNQDVMNPFPCYYITNDVTLVLTILWTHLQLGGLH